MKPTKQQNNAILTRDKTLLVSAGAGSGKTTVLTKRLIERIRSGDEVTDFLVVTFMKAAAADVKRKLYDALLEESSKEPDNTHLFRQLHLVSEADICTISSYCLNLVKENFAALGISPRVRVIDETESALLLRRVVDELIKKGYDEESPSFLLLADNFTGDKNDDNLAEKMIKLYNTLSVTLNREEMLLSCAEHLHKDAQITRAEGFFSSETGKELKTRLKVFYAELLESARELYEYATQYADDKYLGNVAGLLDICQSVYNSLDSNYVNYISAARTSLKTPALNSGTCDEEAREYIKTVKADITANLKKYYERYCRGDESFVAVSLDQCADTVVSINSFLTDVEREYRFAKLELGALDYTDFELYALELLETTDENGNKIPTELCRKKQESFKEILIDEYQDVNPLQDRLFTLLSGKSHRFMVGDVKQSIYRFRNAYPDIFLGYKGEFPEIDSADHSENACIFLRENFRCSKTVINYVNRVFQCITEDTPYRAEYEGEWLVYPDKVDETPKPLEFPVVVAVADKEKDNAAENRRDEAEFIASEIYRLVHEGTDSKGKPLQYKDFAVMLGAMKGYSIPYEKAFRKFGIPYKTAVSSNFLDNPIINLAVCALRTIDDAGDDISLCSLLRSPIFNFTSNDLYLIRRSIKDTSFYSALANYAAPKLNNTAGKKFRFKRRRKDTASLFLRCCGFLRQLSDWREESVGKTCRDFLKSFFVSSGLLRIAADGGRESLLLLYEYSSRYENADNYGVSGFLDYLTELSKSGKEIPDAANVGDEDAISFITVHKSKGLEFKVCFLAGADKEFRGLKESSDINFRRGKGIFFKLRDVQKMTTYNPICNILAVDNEKDQMRGEELRKLYVALTRAKERLYITGCMDVQKRENIRSPMSARSWLELLLYVNSLGECSFFNVIDIETAKDKAGYLAPERKKLISPTKEMADIISYRYPYKDSVNSAAKISVSELREGLLEDDEYNRTHLSVPLSRVAYRPSFAGDELIGAAEIGTANHLFMQFCDFANAEKDITLEAKRLLERRMITQAQFDMLDIPALQSFFKGGLYQLIRSSSLVYREKRFSVKDSLDPHGEPILVQGVIDCFFQNPDGSYTVVDYKTDRVRTFDELTSRHKVQLDCYRRAVESMTNCKVSRVLLYSFALGGEVEVK